MKKFLLAVFSFFLLFGLSKKDSLAACVPCGPGYGSVCRADVCTVGGTNYGPINVGATKYNCDTSIECTNLQLQNAQSTGTTAPVQNPTCQSGSFGSEINTAIGCINFQDVNVFMGLILKWLVGIGGGVAFLLILSASFTIMTSNGNPERLKAGQETLTAAVSGLILLIFSIFVLKIVGVDILGLGSFGFGSGGQTNSNVVMPQQLQITR